MSAFQAAGIDKNYFTDIIIGVGVSLAFLVASVVLRFSLVDLLINLVYPGLSFSISDRFLVIGFLAGGIEEPAFRFAVPYLLFHAFTAMNVPGALFWAYRAANVSFSAFHLLAYGTAAVAAFVGAYLFGELMTFLNHKTHSFASNIAAHVSTNLIIIAQKFTVVGA